MFLNPIFKSIGIRFRDRFFTSLFIKIIKVAKLLHACNISFARIYFLPCNNKSFWNHQLRTKIEYFFSKLAFWKRNSGFDIHQNRNVKYIISPWSEIVCWSILFTSIILFQYYALISFKAIQLFQRNAFIYRIKNITDNHCFRKYSVGRKKCMKFPDETMKANFYWTNIECTIIMWG